MKTTALIISAFMVSSVSAHPCKKPNTPSAWKGTNASLGASINTGNTRTTNFNGQLTVQYTQSKWNNNLQLQGQLSRDTGVTTKEKYFFQNQYNYTFDKASKKFVFVNGSMTIDHFSPYSYQLVLSAGYGCNVIKTKKFLLNVQAGPGLRRNKDRISKAINNRFILATQLNATWNLSQRANMTEALTYNIGSPYDYLKSVTAFTNQITGNWNWQVSVTVEHYSSIPPSSENLYKTDTTTNIAIMYTL